MNDLLWRLRNPIGQGVMHQEAAAEIERLQDVALPEKQRQVDYWGDRCCKAEAEIGRLRARISQLEQALHQAGDSIELQEAEQRGFERGRAQLDKAYQLCGQFIGWQRDLYIANAKLLRQLGRLRTLLTTALPFVNDAGDDEDPEAKTAAIEIAENIRKALQQARGE